MAAVNLTYIRGELFTLMYNNVCQTVFMDSVGNIDRNNNKGIVMLDFKSMIRNNNAFQYGTIRVWLYSIDSDLGAILADLEDKFNKAIDDYQKSDSAAKIEFNQRYTYSGHDTERKLRYFVKELTIKIK